MNIQDWFPLRWTGWISFQSKGLSRDISNTTVQKHQFFGAQAVVRVQLSYPYLTTRKTIALTRWTFVGKIMSLLFNMLSRLVMTFLPRSKCLLISWLQSPCAVILEPPKIKSATVSTVSPSIFHEVMGPGAMILVFWMLSFKPTFSLSSFPFIKRLFSLPHRKTLWGYKFISFISHIYWRELDKHFKKYSHHNLKYVKEIIVKCKLMCMMIRLLGISLEEEPRGGTAFLHYCFLTAFPLLLPSLMLQISNRICPSDLREGLGS